MFVLVTIDLLWVAFALPALPGFIAIPAPDPRPVSFASLPITVGAAYSAGFSFPAKNLLWPAWLVLVHYVLLDAVCDPEAGTVARL
jgi:hypothetical protein